jgi:hypothetical protein
MISAVIKNGTPDAQRKACFDCDHCKGAISWWCRNKDAIGERETQIPGIENCPYWKPVKTLKELKWWERFFGSYVVIDARIGQRKVLYKGDK